MPVNYSSKRIRDAATFTRWDALPDNQFMKLGLSRDSLKQFQSSLVGHVVLMGDADYDDKRHLSNPVFNRYPLAIVYCAVVADVPKALKLAVSAKAEFCVRSGGHSTAGYSVCDGVVIDLSKLDSVTVNTTTMIATADAGCTFDKFFSTLQTYGVHVPAGECPDVAVGGFVQGGGYGFTSVTYGLNCDNVVGFKVLLASGDIVEASASKNKALFWALRGGTGGNFGIVLSVDYALRPLGDVSGFALVWKLDQDGSVQQAAQAMMVLQEQYMSNSICGPEMNLQMSLCFQNYFLPGQPPAKGAPLIPCFMIRGMWLGEKDALPKLLDPLTSLPGCITQWVDRKDFLKMNEMLLNYPEGMPDLSTIPYEDKASRYIDRNLLIEDWATLIDLFVSAPHNMAYGYAEFYGGQINTVPRLDTAFVHRNSLLNLVMDVFWSTDADRQQCEWFLRAWNEVVEPLSNGESYQNYPSAADPFFADRFWVEAYPMLQVIKYKYDQGNLFQFPQQIIGAPADQLRDKLAAMPPDLVAGLDEDILILVPAGRD